MSLIARASLLAFLTMLVASAGCNVESQNSSGEKFFPTPSANNVCPDTPLRITFSKPMTLGTSGKIQIVDSSTGTAVETIDIAAPTTSPAPTTAPGVSRMPASRAAPTRVRTIGGLNNYNYYPVIVTGNQAEIFPAPGSLAIGKTYYVTIDTGVFTDQSGPYAGVSSRAAWKFSTKAKLVEPDAEKLIVAADGTGDFATIQGALDSIPAGNRKPTTIFVHKGTYTEMIYVSDKHSITILGEDRKRTVLEYATNDRFNGSAGGGGYRRGVFRANRCNDLILTNLTIRNTTPQNGSQAEAIIFNGSPNAHAIVSDVDLFSFQDTLQINGQAYIKNCYIEGDVDFMWGTGPCFFENCTARTVRSNAYFTQIRNTAANHGYVYYQCTLEGAPGVTGNFLSRIEPNRFPNSEVVLIDCVLDNSVGAAAWRLDGGATTAPNVHFWEYNSRTSDGKPVDVSKRFPVSRQLKQPEDTELISNYSDPAFVLGNDWNPRKVSIPKAP